MADGNVLNDELLKLVQQVVRQQMNSFQPRPKRLRRPRASGGGGGDGGSNVGRFARVVHKITKAGSNLREDWGSGDVWFIGNETGDWVEDLQTVPNRWPIEYPVGALVVIYGEGDVHGLCGPASAGFWKVS